MENLILIGMPGVGKSTVGVVLAKTLGYSFLDTDLLIQMREKMLLQEIVDRIGVKEFIQLEGKFLCSLTAERSVISTGGSAVYSEEAMLHLQKLGRRVYLRLPLDELERRVDNITTRGLAMEKGQCFSDLYAERVPLYEKYADITVDCTGLSVEHCISEISSRL